MTDEVRQRASHACEYCRLPESVSRLTFQVDPIIARPEGGKDGLDNLALACPSCNGKKGLSLSGIDPVTKRLVGYFHPRRDQWTRHFRCEGAIIVGRTSRGRATVRTLDLNCPELVAAREGLIAEGLFPPRLIERSWT